MPPEAPPVLSSATSAALQMQMAMATSIRATSSAVAAERHESHEGEEEEHIIFPFCSIQVVYRPIRKKYFNKPNKLTNMLGGLLD